MLCLTVFPTTGHTASWSHHSVLYIVWFKWILLIACSLLPQSICPLNYLIVNKYERSHCWKTFLHFLSITLKCTLVDPLVDFSFLWYLTIFGSVYTSWKEVRKDISKHLGWRTDIFEIFFNWNSKHTPSRKPTRLIPGSKIPLLTSPDPFIIYYWLYATILDVFAYIFSYKTQD